MRNRVENCLLGLHAYSHGEFTMKLAYLVNQYPSVSHTFIRREIEALERGGIAVRRFTIRRSRTPLVDPADIREQRATFCLLGRKWTLLYNLLAVALADPGRFLSACRTAITLSRAGGAGYARHCIYLTEAALLVRICHREGISHLHAHFGTNPAAVALLCEHLGGPSYSFTVHGPDEFDRPLALREKIHAARFAVAISEFGRGQLLRWVNREDWQKIHIVHCGLDEALLEAPAVPLPADRSLVCVGRLCEQKGHMVLLEAMATLCKRFPDVSLTLVGDGPLRQVLEERVAELELGDRVRFVGSCRGEEVRRHIQSSRIMVLPSFAEGLPVVLMEAFALQRPVVSTYVAGIPELVEDGKNGWLVPAGSVEELAAAMGDALARGDEQLVRMAAHGNAAVRARHDVVIETKKLVELFRAEASLALAPLGSLQPPALVSAGAR
jgi:colanic acid/amylovoran biosynthesis glycosyltransferase